jgi:hypothetical protein
MDNGLVNLLYPNRVMTAAETLQHVPAVVLLAVEWIPITPINAALVGNRKFD